MFDEVYEYFTKALILMQKPNKKYLEFILDKRRKLLKKCEKHSQKHKNEAKLIIYLGMLIQNIHNPKSVLIA